MVRVQDSGLGDILPHISELLQFPTALRRQLLLHIPIPSDIQRNLFDLKGRRIETPLISALTHRYAIQPCASIIG